MARVSTIVTNFQSGELTPRLEGRVDLQKYNAGVQTLQNMVVFPQGGITRRTGSYYVHSSKDGGEIRLVNFEFGADTASEEPVSYVLEFGLNYIRFYNDEEILTEATKSITGITAANPAVVTASSHGYSNGDRVFIKGIVGMTELNNREFTVAGATTNTFELSGINSSAFTAYSSGGTSGKIVEITTTYTVAQVKELTFAQSADVMFIAHRSHAPAQLTRTTATSFTLADVDFVDGPYEDENIGTTTITSNANTGTVTLTASADLFASSDVGSLFRFRDIVEVQHDAWSSSDNYSQNDLVRHNGNVYKKTDAGSGESTGAQAPVHTSGSEVYGNHTWQFQHSGTGFVKITAVASATSATAVVQNSSVNGNINTLVLPKNATDGTTRWSRGAFSSRNGFPRAVAFYEERLFFAGTTAQPQSIFGSVTDDFTNHSPGTNDDDAINLTIASDQVNVIKHMIPGRFLQILTTSAEFTLSGGTQGAAVTPTSVNVLRETTFGTSNVRPLRAGASTILVQKSGEKVKEVTFDLNTDGLVGRDLTILGEHLAKGGLIDMVWQQEPELILWFVRFDGVLIGLSYDPANNTVGWHQHPFGNSGVVESVTSIPSGTEDQVYLSVKRTINSSTVRHIVYLKSFNFNQKIRNAFFVDSGVTIENTAKAITGVSLSTDQVSSVTIDHQTLTVTSSSHGFSNGDDVVINDVVGMTELNGDSFTVFNSQTNTFELANPATKSIKSISKANPANINIDNHGFATNDQVAIFDIVGMTTVNNTGVIVTKVDDNNFTINVDLSSASGFPAAKVNNGSGISSGSTVIDIDNVSGTISTGMVVTGTNIASGTTVVALAGQSKITLSTATTGTIADDADLVFLPNSGVVRKATNGTPFTTYISGGEIQKKISTVTGINHLEGETVAVLVDGASHADKTVTNGNITLDRSGGVIHVGYNYDSLVETLRMEAGADDGISQGKIKRIHGVTARFIDTVGAETGPDLNNLDRMPFRDSSMAMDGPIPLFNGDKEIFFPSGYDNDAQVIVRQNQPLPMTILAIMRRSNTFDA